MPFSSAAALECIFNEVSTLPGESIPLEKAGGRYLLRGLFAPISLPPFDSSAMDGFALQASDTLSASPSSPVALKISHTLFAGNCSPLHLQKNEAGRIMTGAPLPAGADTVVPFEEANEKEGFCLLSKPLAAGKHVRRKGEDLEQGKFLFGAGTVLHPRNIALLAALGIAEITVTRIPQVAFFSTGDELKPLGSRLDFGQIYDSNALTLSLALRELGIEAMRIPTPRDNLEELENALRTATNAEVILTMGSVSAGDLDLLPRLLKKMGAKILFHKLAIKPGKPLLFARWENRYVFCLPGNPVSALVVYDRFVRPALLKMMGAASFFCRRYTAIAAETINASVGKEDYLQAQVEWNHEKFVASLAGRQGSAQLSTMAKSNALLIIPEWVSQINEGEKVEFEFWREHES